MVIVRCEEWVLRLGVAGGGVVRGDALLFHEGSKVHFCICRILLPGGEKAVLVVEVASLGCNGTAGMVP